MQNGGHPACEPRVTALCAAGGQGLPPGIEVLSFKDAVFYMYMYTYMCVCVYIYIYIYIFDARRSSQSILKDINPEYSLEGLMPKLKLQSFGQLM